MIDFRHLFYRVTSFAIGPALFLLDFLGVCHISAQYVIARRIIAMYICLALLSVVPQVEAAIFVRVSDCEAILA